MRHVIIGNSAAAVGAVEAIRRHDSTSSITIISDEPHHVYSRPLISYLLGGLVDESHMYYRPPEFYDYQRVEAMLGIEVTGIDTAARIVQLANGEAVPYDRLLIATGGRPFIPPVTGARLDGVFTFTRWEDAREIERYIARHDVQSVLVIGGGLIGLKATEALLERGLKITLVELADRVLSISFDRTASKLAEGILAQAGVEIHTGTSAQEIGGTNGRVDHAVLQGGTRLDCDMVIFAIGVRPNVGFIAPESDIHIERGIVVDLHMRTSVPDVYAAGDCAETYDKLLGINRPIAIWPNAHRQGTVAGSNMAGVDKEYDGGFPMNSVEVCGVPTISVGVTDPREDTEQYEVLEFFDRSEPVYKKLVLRGNRLVGAICVGNIDRAGIYTGLIRDAADISPFKNLLLSGNFGLISLPQDYRKHLVIGDGIEV